jgi:hypothetical protein
MIPHITAWYDWYDQFLTFQKQKQNHNIPKLGSISQGPARSSQSCSPADDRCSPTGSHFWAHPMQQTANWERLRSDPFPVSHWAYIWQWVLARDWPNTSQRVRLELATIMMGLLTRELNRQRGTLSHGGFDSLAPNAIRPCSLSLWASWPEPKTLCSSSSGMCRGRCCTFNL